MAGVVLGRYRVIEALGEGGMGIVYRAEDPVLERSVAIKVIHPRRVTTQAKDRFLREARAVARLDHPHIIKIFDIGVQPDGDRELHYIVMEFVRGQTLAAAMNDQGVPNRSTVDQRLDLFVQLLLAMSYAHESGVVHRDLKPENVMITKDYGVKVMDFGLAVLDGNHSQTRENQVMGTLAYFAPEQAGGKQGVDFRADIYTLGVILFEILTGRLPFDGSNPLEFVHKILYESPPSLTSFNPALPVALEKLVLRAMSKEPAHRFSSILEMKTALEQARKPLPPLPGLPAFKPKPLPTPTFVLPPVKPLLMMQLYVPPTSLTPAPLPAPPATQPQSLSELILPLRLHLVEGTSYPCSLSLEQAVAVHHEVNAIWKAAGIQWKLVGCQSTKFGEEQLASIYPNAEANATRQVNGGAIADHPACEATAVNVLLVKEIPHVPANGRVTLAQNVKGRRVCVVSQIFAQHAASRNLARALAAFLGLTLSAQAPPDRLVSSGGGGTALDPQEIQTVRAKAQLLANSFQVAPDATWVDNLKVPLRFHLVVDAKLGTAMTVAQSQQLFQAIHTLWLRAGIRLLLMDSQRVEVDTATLERAVAEAGAHKPIALTQVSPFDPGCINVFALKSDPLGKVGYQDAQNKTILLFDDVANHSKNLAVAIGFLLGLTANEYAPPTTLVSGARNDQFLVHDLYQVRAGALRLFPKSLKVGSSPVLRVPLRGQVVRSGRTACKTALAQVREYVSEVQTMWRQANLEIELLSLGECSVAAGALEAMYLNGPESPPQRRTDTNPLKNLKLHDPDCLNFFLVETVPYDTGSKVCSSLFSREDGLALVPETYPLARPAKALACSLARLLGLGQVNHPEALVNGNSNGIVLSPEQILDARKEVQRRFHASALAPAPKGEPMLIMLGGLRQRSDDGFLLWDLADSSFVGLMTQVVTPTRGALDLYHVLGPPEVEQLKGILRKAVALSQRRGQPGPYQEIGRLGPQGWLPKWMVNPDSGQLWISFDRFHNLQQSLSREEAARSLQLLEGVCPGGLQGEPLEVDRFEPESQTLVGRDGRRLTCQKNWSHAWGPEGEWLGMDGLQSGDLVQVWMWGNRLLRVQAVRCRRSNQSLLQAARTAREPERLFQSLCALGEQADRLQAHEQDEISRGLYEEILRLFEARQVEEVYLYSKVTLGLILLHLRRRQPDAAYELWSAKKMPFGLGVKGLDGGCVSSHDSILYTLVSSWIYAMLPDAGRALERMNAQMDGLCSHLAGLRHMLLPLALNNWLFYLGVNFCRQPIPEAAKRSLEGHCQKAGIRPVAYLDLPEPDSWTMDS